MFITYLIKFEETQHRQSSLPLSSFLFRVQRRKSSEGEWITDDTITDDTTRHEQMTNIGPFNAPDDIRHATRINICSFTFQTSSSSTMTTAHQCLFLSSPIDHSPSVVVEPEQI